MADEGYVEVEGGRVWYRRLGGGDALPGPAPARRPRRGPRLHAPARRAALRAPAGDRLRPARLRTVRPPDDTSLWTLDRFAAEVDQVRTRSASIAATCSASRGADGSRSTTWPAARRRRRSRACEHVGEHRAVRRRRPGLIDELPEPHRTALTDSARGGSTTTPTTGRASRRSTAAICAGSTPGRMRSSGARHRWRETRCTRR